MGRLVTLNTLGLDATWFFDDAYWVSSGPGSYKFDWPSKNFPHQFCMHKDNFQHIKRKSEIRKWIENTISDTVIFDSVDMDYKKFYGKSYEWEKKYDIRNTWYRFSFENEHSASMFRLAFSDWIQPMSKWHPDRPQDEEYLNRPLEERYIK
jgi:hypothetical protein